MTIQTSNGNIEANPPGDKIHVINGTQFVVKVRIIGGDPYLVVGWNHGSGWSEGVFAMNDPLPPAGDAHAILAGALPAINSIIAANAGGGPAPADLPHQMDALIQTLHVVNNQLSL